MSESETAVTPDFAPHRLIRASAGAGKTYQLATRYLSLLRLGAEPAHILATTFTRKAAGEISGRILNRLARAIERPDELAQLDRDLASEPLWKTAGSGAALTRRECQAMLARLIASLHRVNVSTLDSFFSRITHTFALELNVPADPVLLDDRGPQAQELRLRAIEMLLGEAAGGVGESDELDTLIALLRQVHHDQLKRSVTQSIDDLVVDLYDVYRDTGDPALWSALHAPGLLTSELLQTAIERLEAMEPALPTTKQGKPNATWQRSFAESLRDARVADWDAFIARGLPAAIATDKPQFSRVEIPTEWEKAYHPLVQHAKAVQIDRLKRQTESTFELLQRFDRHFTALRQQRRALLFSDLSYKLAHELPALGPEIMTEVYFRLDARVNHLLIDEFQDTSLNQWAVLAPMVEEVTAQGEADRSAFIVGDSKQSIYGWRGGCAELFDDVETQLAGAGLQSDTLSDSYRSSPVVLDTVNLVFETLDGNPGLAEDADTAARWQAQFDAHRAAPRVADLPGHVRLMSTPAPGDSDDDEPDDPDTATIGTHERFVAQQIAELRRVAPGRSIGVLVRRRSAAATMLYELRRLGMDASGEGGHPVTDIPAVTAVLAALTLADHPGDKVAAFHVVNSPVGEMLGLADAFDRRAVRDVAQRVRRRLIAEGYAETLSDWVAQLAPSCDARSLARLSQLIELAERYEADAAQPLRPGRFVDFAAQANVEEPAPASVRVMTIHASKGLEFDAVVLPELDALLREDTRVLVQRDTPTGPVHAVYRNPEKQIRAMVPEVQEAFEQHRDRQRFEDLCTLYVAMTRAKQALHMYVKPRRLNKNGKFGKLSKSLASVVREALRDPNVAEDPAGGEVLYERGAPDWAGPMDATAREVEHEPEVLALHLARPGAEARRSWLTVSPSSLEAAGRVGGADLLDLKGAAARQRGTLIHTWLEMIGFWGEDGALPDDDALVDAARQRMPEVSRREVQSELASLHVMLAHEAVRDALRRHGADTLWREREFVVRHEGKLLRGTFDRVAVRHDAKGEVVEATLIDFKTDDVRDEAARDAAVQRYRPQIEAYRSALARVLRVEAEVIAGKLVFVGTGEVVAV
ncbi:MAG: UvrD-helicase domain-containing protein [Phycisphaeraceae bacterium]